MRARRDAYAQAHMLERQLMGLPCCLAIGKEQAPATGAALNNAAAAAAAAIEASEDMDDGCGALCRACVRAVA